MVISLKKYRNHGQNDLVIVQLTFACALTGFFGNLDLVILLGLSLSLKCSFLRWLLLFLILACGILGLFFGLWFWFGGILERNQLVSTSSLKKVQRSFTNTYPSRFLSSRVVLRLRRDKADVLVSLSAFADAELPSRQKDFFAVADEVVVISLDVI